MITIDGSVGEGGGQILRSALALSLVTGKPFSIEHIRAGRPKPGILRQHLTAVAAAAEVSRAEVTGNSIGSTQLRFAPGRVRAGSYHWEVGTAGSTTLVLQTVLPCLLTAEGESRIVLEGGTHNPYAPPFDFLVKAFLPVINRMGPSVEACLERPGFYPAGGGRFTVAIKPVPRLSKVDLTERGAITGKQATALIAQIPRRVAETELAALQNKLSWEPECFRIETAANSRGPGNILMCVIESECLKEVVTTFGQQGVPALQVASELSDQVREYLASGVPVGRHLADQLMIPMALAGGGTLQTLPLTRHARTNMEVIRKFLNVEISTEKLDRLVWRLRIAEKES